MGHSAGPLVSVEEHLAACLASVHRLPPTRVPLRDALGLTLAEDVCAQVSIPGFDNSAMDGYAVHASAVADANPSSPVYLRVVDDLPAGRVRQRPFAADEAVRIMTGAALPPGSDDLGVVPVEDTDAGTSTVSISAPTSPGRHVRRAAEDVSTGDVVLRAGQRVTPTRLALAAAVGASDLSVSPPPRVLVLATGDELVEPGHPLAPGQIYESNGFQLQALVEARDAVAIRPPRVADDAARLTTVLAEHLDEVDLVVTSGGVSAGAYDVVKSVLLQRGTVAFRKVAMQPGMPQGCGWLSRPSGQTVPIVTLPGNPVSTYVSFEVFVRPVLAALTGSRENRAQFSAAVRSGWRSPAGKRQFARVQLDFDDAGPTVAPIGGQLSHLVADLAASNALAVVAEDVREVRPGDRVTVWPLEPLDTDHRRID